MKREFPPHFFNNITFVLFDYDDEISLSKAFQDCDFALVTTFLESRLLDQLQKLVRAAKSSRIQELVYIMTGALFAEERFVFYFYLS